MASQEWHALDVCAGTAYRSQESLASYLVRTFNPLSPPSFIFTQNI